MPPTRERQNKPAVQIVNEFFDDFNLKEVGEILWQVYVVASTSDNEHFQEASARANLLEFYLRTEELMEAAYDIAKI